MAFALSPDWRGNWSGTKLDDGTAKSITGCEDDKSTKHRLVCARRWCYYHGAGPWVRGIDGNMKGDG